jgi:hypothetical protein
MRLILGASALAMFLSGFSALGEEKRVVPRETLRTMLENYTEQQELASLLMTPTEIVDRLFVSQKLECKNRKPACKPSDMVPESARPKMIDGFTRAHEKFPLSYRGVSDCLKRISETDVKGHSDCFELFQKTVEREKFAKGLDGGTSQILAAP